MDEKPNELKPTKEIPRSPVSLTFSTTRSGKNYKATKMNDDNQKVSVEDENTSAVGDKFPDPASTSAFEKLMEKFNDNFRKEIGRVEQRLEEKINTALYYSKMQNPDASKGAIKKNNATREN